MSATRLAVTAAGVLATAHAAPAVTSIGPLRRRLFPGLAGVGEPGHVALTFDDGPDPRSTPAFLAALRESGVKATFFLLGRMLKAAPDLGRELAESGHEIAVHGWEHRCMLLRGPAATYDDMARAMESIVQVTGTVPRWYRPPYGVLSSSALRAARRLGLTPVLWTNWGRDWTRAATPASILETLMRDLGGGGTVLLHDSDCTSAPDSWRNTLDALPPLLEGIRDRGLSVGPLRDHGQNTPRQGPRQPRPGQPAVVPPRASETSSPCGAEPTCAGATPTPAALTYWRPTPRTRPRPQPTTTTLGTSPPQGRVNRPGERSWSPH